MPRTRAAIQSDVLTEHLPYMLPTDQEKIDAAPDGSAVPVDDPRTIDKVHTKPRSSTAAITHATDAILRLPYANRDCAYQGAWLSELPRAALLAAANHFLYLEIQRSNELCGLFPTTPDGPRH